MTTGCGAVIAGRAAATGRTAATGRAAAATRAKCLPNLLTAGPGSLAHGYWAADPLWQPPRSGQPVPSWRDSGGNNAVQATAARRPTFTASKSTYSARPTVDFASASTQYLDAASVVVNQTFWVVAIANTGGANSVAERLLGTGVATNRGLGDTGANLWTFTNGTTLSGGTADANPHLWVAKAMGATSTITIDGVTVASGASNTESTSRITIGAGSLGPTPTLANHLNGSIHFLGVYTADPTADAAWPVVLLHAQACGIAA